jgi:sigma-B regulation protein RsbU (phosphoserine phosphatase)
MTDVLLVEDDPVTRMILRAQLSRLGYGVIIASDGVEGWERYRETGVSLVVTDWAMPRMDGLTLCQRIRGSGDERYTYIIILTAAEKGSGFSLAVEAGADDFISKPSDLAEMGVRLRVAERILSLQAHVARLTGLVPICPRCKKMRDYAGAWHSAELYLTDRSEARFSHGICPSCFATIVRPQLEDIRRGGGQA